MLELESIRAKRERTTQVIKYHQWKSAETQTILLNTMSDIEAISSNEIRTFLEMSRARPRATASKEQNTDMDLLWACSSPRIRVTTVNQAVAATIDQSEKVNCLRLSRIFVNAFTGFRLKWTQSELIEIRREPTLYICKYAYKSSAKPQLELNAGECLFVLGDIDDDGFHESLSLDGKRGLVPSTFLERVDDLTKDQYRQMLTRCE
jgi:hypothetical protein